MTPPLSQGERAGQLPLCQRRYRIDRCRRNPATDLAAHFLARRAGRENDCKKTRYNSYPLPDRAAFETVVRMDTEHGTREIRSGHLFVAPGGTRHRARVEGRATLLVVDNMG